MAGENITCVDFYNTDFTFRNYGINERKKLGELGRSLEKGFSLPAMNPEVAERIIEWLEAH